MAVHELTVEAESAPRRAKIVPSTSDRHRLFQPQR
jgi:hypothetical protein